MQVMDPQPFLDGDHRRRHDLREKPIENQRVHEARVTVAARAALAEHLDHQAGQSLTDSVEARLAAPKAPQPHAPVNGVGQVTGGNGKEHVDECPAGDVPIDLPRITHGCTLVARPRPDALTLHAGASPGGDVSHQRGLSHDELLSPMYLATTSRLGSAAGGRPSIPAAFLDHSGRQEFFKYQTSLGTELGLVNIVGNDRKCFVDCGDVEMAQQITHVL